MKLQRMFRRTGTRRIPTARQKLFPALGTINSIALFGSVDPSLPDRMKAYVLELDHRLSVFRPDSEISTINRYAGLHPVAVHRDTYEVLSEGVRFGALTDGAFDITSGALTSLWKFHGAAQTVPDAFEIERARALIGWRRLLLRDGAAPHEETSLPARPTAYLDLPGARIDLGGIAKGYAADRLLEMCRAAGVESGLLNLGGTIVTFGPEREVLIQNPFRSTGHAMGSVRLKDRAVVTSGSYERWFEADGRRWHHIIDPKTGRPSESELVSVTLIGTHAARLDALATAVFVLGPEQGMPLLRREGAEAIFVFTDGRVLVTEALQGNFHLDAPLPDLSAQTAAPSRDPVTQTATPSRDAAAQRTAPRRISID